MRRFHLLSLSAAGLLAAMSLRADAIIKTFAGSAQVSGQATSLSVPYPRSVVADSVGNVYIAVPDFNQVFRVDVSGTLTVFAGNGGYGFGGDNGPATNATLGCPYGLAMDTGNNLYIADVCNQRVRKVDVTTGIITTVAGNGSYGFSGDGGDPVQASFRYPWAVALDGNNNLYIADRNNLRIREVSGGVISTIAGSGSPGFGGDGGAASSALLNYPQGVAVDGGGTVYIADTYNQRIRKVTAGVISTFAGTGVYGFSGDGGAATSATLYGPNGLAVDSGNSVYIADTDNLRIRKVDGVSNIITTVAGNGGYGYNGDGMAATSATLSYPWSIAVDPAHNLFIADTDNHRVREVSAGTGLISTYAGTGQFNYYSGDGSAALNTRIGYSLAIAFDRKGNAYITDNEDLRVLKVDAATTVVTTFAGGGSGGDGGPAASASVPCPYGLAVDSNNNVFIADPCYGRVRRVDAMTGVITTFAGTGGSGYNGDGIAATSATLYCPFGLAVDTGDNLYIADQCNQRIRKVTVTTGTISTVAGAGGRGFSGDGGAATSATLSYPLAVAVDGNHNIYIADTANSRIRRVDAATGLISTIAGNGSFGYNGDNMAATSASLSYPRAVAVDNSGNVFISDFDSSRVRKVDASGTITTLAGNGTFGFSGDNGPANQAALNYPWGLAFDGNGNLYVADFYNRRFREIVINPTAVTLSSSLNPSAYGASVTLHAIVAASTAVGATPTGTVQFYDGAVTLGSPVALDGTGSASLSLSTLTGGTHSITAGYSGDATYNPSTSPLLSQVVQPAGQTITFPAIGDKLYTDPPFALGATASSALPVTYAVMSGPATVSGNMVTLTGVGTVVIQATQIGNANYAAATPVTQSFNVVNGSQTITFNALPGKTFGDPDFSVTATASSGLPVTFTAAGNCTVTGSTVSLTGAGSCTITAAQGGNGFYNAAPSVPQSFPIAKAAASIVLSSQTVTYDGSPQALTASTTPAGLTGLALTYSSASYPSSSTAPVNADTYTVTATLTNANYAAASVTATLTINKASQTISFAALADKTYGDPPLTVAATASSSLAVGFSVTGNCTISGNTVTITGAGSCAVTAAQGGSANYNPAPAVTQSFNIAKAAATLSLGSLGFTYDGTPKPVTVTSTPGALTGISVTYNGSGTAPTTAGSYAVVASLNNPNYVAANVTGTLVIAKATPSLGWAQPAAIVFGTVLGNGQLNATATFNAASVAGAFVYGPAAGTLLNVGTWTLSVTFTPSDTTDFNSVHGSVTLTVTPLPVQAGITMTAVPGSAFQYSDEVMFTATLPVLYGLNPATGVTFSVAGQTLPATFVSSGGTLTATVTSGQLLVSPNAYAVTIGFAGVNPDFMVSAPPASLTINPEDARVTYTGALFASTGNATSSTATVTLSATIQDITAVPADPATDSLPGDITHATVTFVNRDASNAVLCTAPVGLVSAGDTKTGTATCNWTANIGTQASASYTVGIIVGGYYTRNSSADNTVVTVSKPFSSNFITGGGYLVLSSSAGLEAGDKGTKNNFGFNVKYNSSGTNLQGNINTIVRRTEADGTLHVYQIKGNSMTSLATQPNSVGGTAVFNGKASIQDITDLNNSISVDGNASLQVNMSDNGEPGTNDTIGVTVWNKTGGLWFSSNWTGTKTVQQSLGGGDLVVH